MKCFVLAAVIVSVGVPLSAASAAILTVNGPLSNLCYQSAVAGDGRSSAIDGCTRALREEALMGNDLAATYVNRGIVFMSAGHAAEADADFDAALKLNEQLPDGW